MSISGLLVVIICDCVCSSGDLSTRIAVTSVLLGVLDCRQNEMTVQYHRRSHRLLLTVGYYVYAVQLQQHEVYLMTSCTIIYAVVNLTSNVTKRRSYTTTKVKFTTLHQQTAGVQQTITRIQSKWTGYYH